MNNTSGLQNLKNNNFIDYVNNSNLDQNTEEQSPLSRINPDVFAAPRSNHPEAPLHSRVNYQKEQPIKRLLPWRNFVLTKKIKLDFLAAFELLNIKLMKLNIHPDTLNGINDLLNAFSRNYSNNTFDSRLFMINIQNRVLNYKQILDLYRYFESENDIDETLNDLQEELNKLIDRCELGEGQRKFVKFIIIKTIVGFDEEECNELDQNNDEIDEWFKLIEEVSNTTENQIIEDLPLEDVTLYKWKQLLFKNGLSFWSDERERKQRFLEANMQVISNLFNEHVSINSSILELGANIIEDDESTLSERIPDMYKSNYVYSDCYKHVAEEEKEFTSRKYLHLNATKLSKQLSELNEDKKDLIVSLNVLIVIERTKLLKIAKEAFASLKPGGQFMILSDNMPHHNPILGCDSTKIAIPWDEEKEGQLSELVTSAPRKDFINNIINKMPQMMPKYRSFYDRFLALTPLQQTSLISKAYEDSLYSLNTSLKEFLPVDGIKTVDVNQSYIEDVENALRTAGFQIQLNEKKIGKHYIQGGEGHYFNFMENDVGRLYRGFRGNIPEEHCEIAAHLQVILAKKPEIGNEASI